MELIETGLVYVSNNVAYWGDTWARNDALWPACGARYVATSAKVSLVCRHEQNVVVNWFRWMIDTSIFAIPFNIGLWEWFFLVVIWNLSIWLMIGYLDSCVHDLEFVDQQVLLTCNENRGKGRSEAWNTSEAISGCFLASRICSPQIFFGGFCSSNINCHKNIN